MIRDDPAYIYACQSVAEFSRTSTLLLKQNSGSQGGQVSPRETLNAQALSLPLNLLPSTKLPQSSGYSCSCCGEGKGPAGLPRRLLRKKPQANFMKVGCAQDPARIWLDKMEAHLACSSTCSLNSLTQTGSLPPSTRPRQEQTPP